MPPLSIEMFCCGDSGHFVFHVSHPFPLHPRERERGVGKERGDESCSRRLSCALRCSESHYVGPGNGKAWGK